MKNRAWSILIALCLMLSLLPFGAGAAGAGNPFKDVGKDAYYYEPVLWAVNHDPQITKGTSTTTFGPADTCTRGQVVTFLWRAAGCPEPTSAKTPFRDVKSDAYYCKAVLWAVENGITQGTSKTAFSPDDPCTRAHVVTFLHRSEGTPKADAKNPFKDVKSDAYYYSAVLWAVKNEITKGTDATRFSPSNPCTRGQIVTFLYRDMVGAEPAVPVKPEPTTQPPTGVKTISKTVAGYSVNGVEFDPADYKADVVLANDRFYSTESASSMVKRSGAAIACNGAFFNNHGDLTTWSAIVRSGKPIRIDNAHAGQTCYFAVDSNGRASMQFLKIQQTATLMRDGNELCSYEDVGCNISMGSGDGSRMVFTHEFGSTVPIKMKCAVYCDENGVVTKAMDAKTAQTISIPEKGFVLCSLQRRDEGQDYRWDKFFEEAKPGDQVRLTTKYGNSSVQDIQTAFSSGPTVVKNGKVYGDKSTYAAEGYTEGQVISGAIRRMAIGVKKDGTVVIASATCDLRGLGTIMQALGCENAMNLDGGSSGALYVNGAAKISPGWALTHLIVFAKK